MSSCLVKRRTEGDAAPLGELAADPSSGTGGGEGGARDSTRVVGPVPDFDATSGAPDARGVDPTRRPGERAGCATARENSDEQVSRRAGCRERRRDRRAAAARLGSRLHFHDRGTGSRDPERQRSRNERANDQREAERAPGCQRCDHRRTVKTKTIATARSVASTAARITRSMDSLELDFVCACGLCNGGTPLKTALYSGAVTSNGNVPPVVWVAPAERR